MGIIVRLRPVRRASLLHYRARATATLRLPSRIKACDLFLSLHRFFFARVFALNTDCNCTRVVGRRGRTLCCSTLPVSEGEGLCVT
jgi:hypothetical protein